MIEGRNFEVCLSIYQDMVHPPRQIWVNNLLYVESSVYQHP